MNTKQKIILGIITTIILGIIVAAVIFFSNVDVAVLKPQGVIADKQRNLFMFTVILSLFVVIPVFTLLAVFAWKYRDTNPKKTAYEPNWDGSRLFETIWWGIPCVIIGILCVITWQTSHDLDPYKKLDSTVKPLNVQAVALQWKWLFIYPDHNIATVNYLEVPEKTPINFMITADAPMNALWIPSLGTQTYAMSGMSMKLHLLADHPGEFRGSSTNISGKGFSDMAFTTKAVTGSDFNNWVQKTHASHLKTLTFDSYGDLAKPGTVKKPASYLLGDHALYDKIIAKYMMPNMGATHLMQGEQLTQRPEKAHGQMNGMDMPGMEE